MAYPLSPRKHENKVPTVSKSAPKAQTLPGPTMAKPGKKMLEGLGRVCFPMSFTRLSMPMCLAPSDCQDQTRLGMFRVAWP